MKMIIFLLAVVLLFSSSAAFSAEKVIYYHTDPAGTPLAMTDSAGNVVWKADYKPFGEEHTVTGSAENKRTFVGKEKDSESGLSCFGARYLNSGVGRFITPDPVGPVDPHTGKENSLILHNPQRQNQYAYGLNNPYRFVDVDGRTPAHLLLAIVGAGASAFGYNMLSPSTANTPGVGEPTIASQTTGEFLIDVAMMETGGRAIVAGGKAILSRLMWSEIRFVQKTISETFNYGEFAGKSVHDVAAGLRSSSIHPDQLPINVITRDGVTYTMNNKSSMALREAGISPTITRDVTGHPVFEKELSNQLRKWGGNAPADHIPRIQ